MASCSYILYGTVANNCSKPLRQLYPSDQFPIDGEPRVDIVAVHGLNPRSVSVEQHAWDTWRKPAGKDGRLWLQSDLPKVTPLARILLYEYNSTLVYGGDQSHFTDKANDLLESLRIDRRQDKIRPLIFLSHSLGGILVQQALVNAHNNAKYSEIRTSTSSLVFFGTPHDGGHRTLVALGSAAARIATALYMQPPSDTIEALKSGSMFADLLDEQWRHQLESYQIVSFWEGVGNTVPKKSATFGLPGERENIVKLNATHSDMCRFDGSQRDQDNFKLVSGNIQDLYEDALRKSQYLMPDSDLIRQILHWVSPIPYEEHHYDNNSDVLHGTGLWLFGKRPMIEWMDSIVSSILWLHGLRKISLMSLKGSLAKQREAGSGKTKLVSIVIDRLLTCEDPHCLAYFYCSRSTTESERSDPQAILRSIVRQILTYNWGKEGAFNNIATIYKERERKHFAKGPLHLEESIALIVELVCYSSKTTILIDALDECDLETRHMLFEALASIMQKASGLVKVFISSRDEKDIKPRLTDLPNLYIEASDNAEDIDCFVENEIEQAILKKRLLAGEVSQDLTREIKSTLRNGAQGMFLWVSLQLQNLCSGRMNVESDVREELGKLPKSLIAVYSRIYEQISDLSSVSQGILERVLQWLMCADPYLSADGFVAAVSIKSDGTVENVSKELILHICSNFVVLDTELDRFRFAHLSVVEFLENRKGFMLSMANATAAETCLVVCLGGFPNHPMNIMDMLPRYAVLFWAYHCEMAGFRRSQGNLWKLLTGFTRLKGALNSPFAEWNRLVHKLMNSWAEIACIDRRKRARIRSTICDPAELADPIFAACVWGLVGVVHQRLDLAVQGDYENYIDLVNPELDRSMLEKTNVCGHTCLLIACANGQVDIVRILLANGANTETADEQGLRAMHWAIKAESDFWTGQNDFFTERCTAIISLLLDNGAHIDVTDTMGQRPLHLAVEQGHTSITKLLLENRADTGTPDRFGQRPLHLAVKKGYRSIIKLLLESRGDIEATDDEGRRPLHLAAELGHTSITKLLLENRADTGTPDRFGQRPLHLAVEQGHTSITKLLLENRADSGTPDNRGRRPLHLAVKKGYRSIIKLLLESRGDIEATDGEGRRPLHLAVGQGHTSITKLLLENRADTGTPDRFGQRPLHLAVEQGHTSITKLLLESRGDIEATDGEGRRPLHLAVGQGHTSITKLLLENRTDSGTPDNSGRTPLNLAAQRGYISLMELLLQNGANIETTDYEGRRPLHLAVEQGHTSMTKLLLDKGADIEVTDNDSRRPLLLAAQLGNKSIVQCLLENGADTEAIDKNGRRPLHLAAQSDDIALVQVLLDNGANIEATDKDGGRPLHLAARLAYSSTTKLLLEHGADIEATDKNGRRPLHLAAQQGDRTLTKFLQNSGADIEAQDLVKGTVLHHAARRETLRVVDVLLSWGANTEARNVAGYTALDIAKSFGHDEIVHLLTGGVLESDVEESSENGWWSIDGNPDSADLSPSSTLSSSPGLTPANIPLDPLIDRIDALDLAFESD